MKKIILLSIICTFSLSCEEEKDVFDDISDPDISQMEVEVSDKTNEELIAELDARVEPEDGNLEIETKQAGEMLGAVNEDLEELLQLEPAEGLANLAYDNINPETSRCKDSARTIYTPTRLYGGEFCDYKYLGQVELRYSSSCRTVWARIKAVTNYYEPGDWAGAVCWIHRNSDGKELKSSHCSSDRKTCWTNMLNDKNVTSYAIGWIDGTCGLGYGETKSYK